MKRLALVFRYFCIALVLAISTAILFPQHASAQLRDQIKNRVVDDVANQLVAEIQSDSCPQFQAMLKSRKSGANSNSKAGGMMKSDPAMRQRFVNKVAGPLVNKMIDCNLLPGK
jgi:hypothetical protein